MENKGKILIADDEEFVCNLVRTILDEFVPDYEKVFYPNGHLLKEELNNSLGGIELVILDNDVPDKSLGLEITKDYSRRGVPFIMMSGYDIEGEAIQNGAYGFIQKPFRIQKFGELVGRALNSKK